jgi:hypothetical protein
VYKRQTYQVSKTNTVKEQGLPIKETQDQAMVSAPISSKKISKGAPISFILLFLLVCSVAGLIYFILKDKGIDLLSRNTNKTATNEETTSTDESKTEDTACSTDTSTDTKDCTVALDNAGWTLFSIPEYKMSVEVPTYTMQGVYPAIAGSADEKYLNEWKVWFDKSPVLVERGTITLSGLLDNYKGRLYIYFYPEKAPSAAGCDQNCLKEQYIHVDIYENSAGKNLDSLVETYRKNWIAQDPDYTSKNIITETKSKWGLNVSQVDASAIGGEWKGYLVSKGHYVYDIASMLSDTPAESYQIALKVIDSMKFTE